MTSTDDILIALKDIIETNNSDDFKTIEIMRDDEMDLTGRLLQSSSKYPACLISDLGEEPGEPEIANTERIEYHIKFRILHKHQVANKPRYGKGDFHQPAFKNINELSTILRGTLMNNKRLGGIVMGMIPGTFQTLGSIPELPDTHYGRDILVVYRDDVEVEPWRQNQDSMPRVSTELTF